jgi:hypothetical protein
MHQQDTLDADLVEFKEIILNKINRAQADLELIKSAYMNDGPMVRMIPRLREAA